jgi:hypothetical protein
MSEWRRERRKKEEDRFVQVHDTWGELTGGAARQLHQTIHRLRPNQHQNRRRCAPGRGSNPLTGRRLRTYIGSTSDTPSECRVIPQDLVTIRETLSSNERLLEVTFLPHTHTG